MNRREFLKTGASVAVGATASAGCAGTSAQAPSHDSVSRVTPGVLNDYSSEDHRRRLMNVALARGSIRSCMRKHLVTDYLPGQCVYNLGEYPARKIWDPD